MTDPLSEIIALLQPRTVFAKGISGAGSWAVRYSDYGQPSFCTVLEGHCRLAVDGCSPIALEAGDFILLPQTPGFVLSGLETAQPRLIDPNVAATLTEEVRHGRQDGEPDVRLIGGYFIFKSPDADLLLSSLPAVIHLRGADRLATLVKLVREEAGGQQGGRDLILSRLVEILVIEALRSSQSEDAPPGLLRGLADARLAPAIREMHGRPDRSWTVADLARSAALSRSAFFDRFIRVVGMPPMEYLVRWRMTSAKELLRCRLPLAEVAARVGYSSTSTFSTAFSRKVGIPPARYARSNNLQS